MADIGHAEAQANWSNLAEIHAAPQWLWSALVAERADLSTVPCWVREMSDEDAYMQLVLCNTQSELHALEEGKHAAESGMDLKAYAEAAGKAYKSLYNKATAYRVAVVSHVGIADIRDQWRNLAEIHAAPNWLIRI